MYGLEGIAEVILPRLITMLALILAATLSGILVAIKNQVFEWRKISDFLLYMVLPNVGGWLLLELVAMAASPETIPAEDGWTSGALVALAWTAYTASFLSLIGRIMANLYSLGVLPQMTRHFARKG